MDFLTELTQFGVLFLMIAAGYVLGKTGRVSDKARDDIASFVLYIASPASIIFGMNIPMKQQLLDDFLLLTGISIGVFLFTFAFSLVSARLLEKRDPIKRSIYGASIYFSNYGFMGWPVSGMFFPMNGMLYAQVFSIPLNVILFSVTPAMLSRAAGQPAKNVLRNILNPPVIGTAIAAALFLLQIQLPDILGKTVQMLGDTQTPLAMAVVGLTLSKMKFRSVFTNGKAYIYAALKLIVLPLMVFGILQLMGFTGTVLGVPVLISAMPAGTMVLVLAQKYGKESEFATQLILLSTVLSLVTIPLFSLLV